MINHEIKVRVRYAETDQMGYVYYGNYATYFEVARVESFRSIGFSYKEMEGEGILMPVLEMKTKFIRPAFYDEELTIKITVKSKPGVRIKFDYEVINEKGILINVAETTLVFVNKENGRPCMPKGKFGELLNNYFE